MRVAALCVGMIAWCAMSPGAAAASVAGALDVPSLIPMPSAAGLSSGTFELTSSTQLIAEAGEPARIARYFAELVARTTPVKLRVGGRAPGPARASDYLRL